jgi:hypothetical protein
MICGGRYLSCDEALRVFAAGADQPDADRSAMAKRQPSVLDGVRADREYEIDEASAGSSKFKVQSSKPFVVRVSSQLSVAKRNERAATDNGRLTTDINSHLSTQANSQPLFEDVSHLLKHVHHEEPYNDFERQVMLPRKLSQLGPGVSWSDVDGDGVEDLLVGSGRGGELENFEPGKSNFSACRWGRCWVERRMTRRPCGLGEGEGVRGFVGAGQL